MQRNILLITNDKTVEEYVKPKLMLLREVDSVVVSNYINAENDLSRYFPEVIILYCSYEQQECLELIKKINSVPIILLMESYDREFVLAAYDEGIKDYITTSATDADILIRTIWCLKSKESNEQYKTMVHLLDAFKIRDPKSGIYIDYQPIFEYEIEKIKKTNSEAVFVAISLNEDARTIVKDSSFADAIKSSLRKIDVIAKVINGRYYLLLNKTNIKGAFTIFERIKTKLGSGLCGGFTLINNQSFEELETETVNALSEALLTDKEVIVVNHDYTSENWIDEINVVAKKNFKLFKQAFNKKLEHVITPVFYRMQQKYQKNLPEAKIEQNVDEKLSIFIVRGEHFESIFKITYPGFSKINIDVLYEGLDTPENKRISFDISEMSEPILESLLDEFFVEIKNTDFQKAD